MDLESTTPPEPVNKQPGIYPGITTAEYWSWPAANFSTLKLFSQTPAHARHEILHPRSPSAAMEFGNALHRLVLQPELFYKEYAKGLGIARRSNEAKAQWKAWEDAHPGVQALDEWDWQALHQMRDSILKHPAAAMLMGERGLNEASILWLDPETKQPCKARIDRLTDAGGVPTIIDLKTTTDAALREFERDIFKFQYHEQAGMYTDGAHVLAPKDRRWVFIAVEKDPPYATAVYELEPLARERGYREFKRHLHQYRQCVETGEWPSFPTDIQIVGLPAWAYKGGDE